VQPVTLTFGEGLTEAYTQPEKTAAVSVRRQEWAQGWPVVAAAFVAMFTVFGIAYSFGAFFDPMAHEFGIGRGATSAIFSITGFLYFTLGVVSGRAADRLGPRRILLAGALAMGAGLVLTAWAPQYWIAWITYGLGVGIGTACGYVPMVAAVGARFQGDRSLAVGIAVTGIGLGTLLVPPLAALLIKAYGWRTSYFWLGLVGAAVLALASLPAASAAVPEGPAGSIRRLVQARAFRRLYLAGLLISFSLFIAFVHIAPFARRLGSDPLAAAGLISVIGGGSVVSRTVLGAVAVRYGALRTFQGAVVVLALSFVIWLAIPVYPALVVFAALLGFGYGGWVALSPSVVAELFGADGLGGSVGALYTSAGIGALVGPWLAGALADISGSYTSAIVAAGVLAFVATGLTLSVRVESK
jgi:MFS family permease